MSAGDDAVRGADAGSSREPVVDTGDAGPWTRVAGGVEWRRDPFSISTDPSRLEIAATTAFLATTEWAADIAEPLVRRTIEGSIAFGVYDGDRQVGFARLVTDRATFAWIGDVFILESHRGLGLALWLTRCILAHPELQELRRWALTSTSARGLYAKVGFTPLAAPEKYMAIHDPGGTADSALATSKHSTICSKRALGLYSSSRDRDQVRPTTRLVTADPLAPFSPAVRDWFGASFEAPTDAQAHGWAAIAAGQHTLIHAPTGSGKTLAAFLWCLDRLATAPESRRRPARRPAPSASCTSPRSRR